MKTLKHYKLNIKLFFKNKGDMDAVLVICAGSPVEAMNQGQDRLDEEINKNSDKILGGIITDIQRMD